VFENRFFFCRRLKALAYVCLGLLSGLGAVQAAPFTIDSTPITYFDRFKPERSVFGKLQFLGGLELTSPDSKDFGGLSGFAWTARDRFVAISDRGHYMSARLQLTGGRPSGVDQAEINILPYSGKGKRRHRMDSEGLDIVGNHLWVSFEGLDRLAIYQPLSSGKLKVRKTYYPQKAIVQLNEDNKGFESIAVAPDTSPHKGAVVILSENVPKHSVMGWIFKNGAYQAFSLPKVGSLRPTDAAFLANGDLVIVERSFSLLGGLKIQLRRIFSKDLKAGSIPGVGTLFSGNLRYELDNIEGLAVQDMPDGSSILTLVSDDNFSSLQRTLLLQFRLPS
jgi:hypothetical protein